MENASKALIIAGAILLSILLISLGIMIFNQAQDTVNNSGMSDAEIETFNSKILKYEGTGKSGSEIKGLINSIIANNSNDKYVDLDRLISITLDSEENSEDGVYTKDGTTATRPDGVTENVAGEIKTSLIKTSESYEIELEYNSNGGTVENVIITAEGADEAK